MPRPLVFISNSPIEYTVDSEALKPKRSSRGPLTLRLWQEAAYNQLKGSKYRAISAVMGSGKSLLAKALSWYDVELGYKVIIAVPQHSLIEGSYGPSEFCIPGSPEAISWAAHSTKGPSTQPVQGVLDFLRKPVKAGYHAYLVTTHQALREASKTDWHIEGEVSLFLDECHFARGEASLGDEEANVTGSLVNDWIERDRGPVTMMSATWFRGDCHQILKKGYWQKFDRYSLKIHEYIEQFGGPSQIQFQYCTAPVEQVVRAMTTLPRKTILFQKRSSRVRSKHVTLRRVLKVFGEGTEEGYCLRHEYLGRALRSVDLVTIANRTNVVDGLIRAIKGVEGCPPDFVLALDLAKLGFDWPECDTVILEGFRSSYTDMVQRIGRCLRAVPGVKTTATIVFVLPPVKDFKTRAKDHLKLLISSMVLEAIFRPPTWVQENSKKAYELFEEDPGRFEAVLISAIEALENPLSKPEDFEDHIQREAKTHLDGEGDPSAEEVVQFLNDMARVSLGVKSEDIHSDIELEAGVVGLLKTYIVNLGIKDFYSIQRANCLIDEGTLKKRAREWIEANPRWVEGEPNNPNNVNSPRRGWLPVSEAMDEGATYAAFRDEYPDAPEWRKVGKMYGPIGFRDIFGVELFAVERAKAEKRALAEAREAEMKKQRSRKKGLRRNL